MKLSTTLATFLPVINALPAASLQAKSDLDVDYFYLRSDVYGDQVDYGTNKSGQYVFSYHTGAGLGMAAEMNSTSGMVAYLNNTDLYFTYNGSIGPWPAAIEYGAYQQFSFISISIAGEDPPSSGFFFNETGLQSTQSPEGWLACDWWYDSPSILANNGYGDGGIPASCSRIRLCPVAASLN